MVITIELSPQDRMRRKQRQRKLLPQRHEKRSR